MSKSRTELDAAIAEARKDTGTYTASPDFRARWLGLSSVSTDPLAELTRAFGQLVGSVTPTLAGLRILDVGCGDGRWLRRMVEYDARPADVIGVDISDARFEIGFAKNPLIQMLRSDGLSLPFADGEFGLVTQFVCLSMCAPPLRRQTISEMSRVLKKGGYLFWWDQLRTDAPSDSGARHEPRDFFDWPIRRLAVGPFPMPSATLRPFPGKRLIGGILDRLAHPATHVAALIGPKP